MGFTVGQRKPAGERSCRYTEKPPGGLLPGLSPWRALPPLRVESACRSPARLWTHGATSLASWEEADPWAFEEGSEAKPWNLYAEIPATFEATVVDLLCEVAGQCALPVKQNG